MGMRDNKGKYALKMGENFQLDTAKSSGCAWRNKYACGGKTILDVHLNRERCVAKCSRVNHCKCVIYYNRYGICRMETGPYLWHSGNSDHTGLELSAPCATQNELAKCEWKKKHACTGSTIGDYHLTRAEGIEKCLLTTNCNCVTFYPFQNISRLETGTYAT